MKTDDNFRDQIDENGKKLLDQISLEFKNMPGVVTRIYYLCKDEIDNPIKKDDCKEPIISVTDNGTKISYSRETNDSTKCFIDEITFSKDGIFEVKIVGKNDEGRNIGSILCSAMKWDYENNLIGYIDTFEAFPCWDIDGKTIVSTHRPKGLENLECHSSGNIMPIRYVRNIFYTQESDGQRIQEITEGMIFETEGRKAPTDETTTRVVYDDVDKIAIFDNRNDVVFDPSLGLESFKDYFDSRKEIKIRSM